MTPISAVVFDLDGLLIDSEPHWRAAEIEIFGQVGLHLSDAQCQETTGLRIDEVVAYRFAQHPWSTLDRDEVARRIVASLIDRLRRTGEAKEGAADAVEFVRAQHVAVGLASSSSPAIIEAALERLGLAHAFAAIHSASDERFGKPHPAVYLTIAERLGVDPTRCLAIEDSLNGVLAARARMSPVHQRISTTAGRHRRFANQPR